MTMSYAAAANYVLTIVRNRMIYGAMNQVGGLKKSTVQAHAGAYGAASPLLDEWKGRYYLPYYLKLAEGAWQYRGGQCDAQSHMAALLLAAYGAFPVDIIAVSYEFLEKRGGKTSHITSAHAFAVTGRPDLTIDGLQNPGLWGKAYVCDPWQGFAYPAIKLKQFLYCGDDIRQGERTFSPAPGDTASFCSDPKRFESFRVDLRLKSEKDLPAELLETWRSRLGEIPN